MRLLTVFLWILLTEGCYTLFGILVADGPLYLSLIGAGVLLSILPLIFHVAVAKRRVSDALGIRTRHPFATYAAGFAGGTLLFLLVAPILLLFHAVAFSPVTNPSVPLILLYAFAFLLQGFGEEVLCRAFLLGYARETLGETWAVVLSSGLFAALHLANDNISILALINVFLFGVLASLLCLRSNSLWLCAGLHSAWNFAQGCIFGFPVSGITGFPSILHAAGTDVLFSGGAFGPEGGIVATTLFTVCILPLLLGHTKKTGKSL